MISKQLLPVLAAVVGVASGDTCTQDTFTINSQSDIKPLANCETLNGNVVVGPSAGSSLDFTGPLTIKGDFTAENNGVVTTLKSSSLGQITGAFTLGNLTGLSTLSFTGLKSVGSVSFQSLTTLDSLTFTAGISEASDVVVSDTFLSTLEGLNVESVSTININNNRRLTEWTSQLTNVSSNMNMNANGLDFQVSLPALVWVANMTISNVTSFSIPALQAVNGSMRMDSNFFQSFSAPNLTSTSSGDISFVSNGDLSNITMPLLTGIGGGFQIANNTGLQTVDGFGALKTVGGAVKFRGSFTSISLPSLNDVKGAFDVESTQDISSSCSTFSKLAPTSKGGNGEIQGTYTCTGDVANANSDTSSNTNGSSSGGGGSGGNGNSAAGIAINMVSVLGLTGAGVLMQALL